jgi:hypothetical protein
VAWSRSLADGGIVALHDVDDHPGVGFTARHILKSGSPFRIWGYCPNILILKKVEKASLSRSAAPVLFEGRGSMAKRRPTL